MITAEDIKLLMASGEGYNAEFKVSVPSKVRELTEEVCAFANAAGGVLLIGVNDQNQLVGLTIDNAKRSAIQNSLSEITPALPCTLSFVEVDGKNIGVIEVPSGVNKPYVFSGAIFVRIGPNTQKLTTAEQMRDFFQQSDKIYFDEMPCPEFQPDNMTDLDFLSVFKAESHISSGVPNEQIFRSLKLYSNGNQFKNGAVLFFGLQPDEIIPTAVLRCVAYQGTEKRFIIDDKPFTGNLVQQFQQAMNWLRSKLEIRYDIEGQGSAPRREIWEIPETVFKEAILNALAHRDYYDKGGVILLELFDDRVELSNPGGLVSAIPESEFGKRSHSRNPLIFGLFARMHLVEQVGSGIVRMQDLMKEAKLPPPQFQKTGIFTVTLIRPEKKTTRLSGKISGGSSVEGSVKSSVKSSVKIVAMMKENENITISEIAESLGLTTRAIEKQIAKLKEKGLISRIGSEKGGFWQVNSNEE